MVYYLNYMEKYFLYVGVKFKKINLKNGKWYVLFVFYSKVYLWCEYLDEKILFFFLVILNLLLNWGVKN